jgi:citrate lyase beta subunit
VTQAGNDHSSLKGDRVKIERTMLFVPATKPDKIAKAATSGADAVCIDLEDSVAPSDKAVARQAAIKALRDHNFGDRVRMLRVNGLDTQFAYRDFVEVVEGAGGRLDRIMLPKAGSAADVGFAERMLAQIEMNCGLAGKIGLEVQIETAAGFLNIREIASASPRIEAIVFGPGDYAASMRMPSASIGEPDENDRIYGAHRWHAVMHAVVAAGRANSLTCMDGPYAGFKDQAGFERSCRVARAMGFDGKQCIHPSQLATANSIFSPTPEEIAHAQRVVAACQDHGAGVLGGRMVDAANLRMAKWVVEQAKLIRVRERSAN